MEWRCALLCSKGYRLAVEHDAVTAFGVEAHQPIGGIRVCENSGVDERGALHHLAGVAPIGEDEHQCFHFLGWYGAERINGRLPVEFV